ncbi:deoxynucleotide monophosphate kinase [Tropicimonas sp. IMCC34043]|uniref:deoxynucleotide monophosphate kinase family protein n=1 Tax=Tropicimonas sp. IMCC34043 TaxID=2248760 RepID=UPI000E283A69|nr:deoxynucleotide monophosphate kinase [Tropicimonas sp. IMCC34043]
MTGRLIALAGRAGSGKSAAAKALPYDWDRRKFADPLKNMLRALYRTAGLAEAEIERRIEGDLKEVPDPILCGATPRWAMRSLGTEWGRCLIDPGLWVSIAERGVASAIAAGRAVVIDDCRFPNEAEAVRRLGGRVVMIERPGADVAAAHSSEAFDFTADATIWNVGPLEALRDAARALADRETEE